MSTPPMRCPGAKVRGWCDGVESVHVWGVWWSVCMVYAEVGWGVKVRMLLMVWVTMCLGREGEGE